MRGLRLGLGLSRPQTAAIGPWLSPLTLSAATIAEASAQGTTVGTIQGATSGSTVTLHAQSAANKFQKDGGDIEAGSSATDYETATSHTITLREALTGAGNTPRDTIITITVTNVLEVTLGALSLDNDTCEPTDAQGTTVGTITGATAGSTVTLHAQSVANAFQKDGDDIEVGSAAPLSEGTPTITLRETHPDGINSPNDTVIPITVETAGEVLGNELHAQPEFDATTGLTLNGWSVTGGQANSNAQNGFLTCTAVETLDTGDYRITIDIASNPGQGDIPVFVANSATGSTFSGTGQQTARVTRSSIGSQTILIRDVDEAGIVLNSISVKKVVSG